MLRELNAATVDRPELPITILQFGGGNFLRAFADHMVHQGNEAGVLHDGIALVHTTRGGSAAAERLRSQDGLYHVLLEGIRDGRPVREYTLVTAVQEVIGAHEDFDRYRELTLLPQLRVIVSNTTESGIVLVPGEDLSARPPASFPAKMTVLLHDRFRHFDGAVEAGLHVLCCELVEDNATRLRDLILHHAAAHDLGENFAAWVRTACFFHDTLVDRIVPGYPSDEIEAVQTEIGFRDRCVVKGEYFGLWAIGGDSSIQDVLPLDRAGMPVQFMEDIGAFRAKKVRILNGLHTAITSVALQLGCESVRDAVARPDVARYVQRLLDQEILPSIPGDRTDLREFAAGIVERFDNPYLHHRLDAIALNSLAKWRARNLPVVLDAWQAGRTAPCSTFALAALLVLYTGRSPDLAGFTVQDDAALVATARDAFDPDDVRGWVEAVVDAAGLIAPGDSRAGRLAEQVAAQADDILRSGVAQALRRVLADTH